MKYNFDHIIPRKNTNSVKFDMSKQLFGKEDILPLWVADMDFATPEFIRKAVIKRAEHEIYGYTFRGEGFFSSILNWMKIRHDWEVKKEWISFSPGIVPALNFSIQAFSKPGDSVIIQPPVYFPFFTAVEDHGRKILHNQLLEKNGRYSIDFEDFEKKAKNASMFLFCHPHNPVGRVWNKEELKRLVNICQQNNVVIISDEIHSDLMLNGNKHIPLLKIEGAREITISFFAPSKTFNLAGLSTSFGICSNNDLKKKFDKQIDQLHIGMGNIFGAVALEAAYTKGADWLDALLLYLSNNLKFLVEFISQRLPVIKVIEAEASYLIWLDFRKLNMNDKDLKEFIINKAGIGFNDGPMFGNEGSGFQRINIALPRKKLEEALLKLEEAIKNYI
jgi:cysteine-S-conjugate beta-lyase